MPIFVPTLPGKGPWASHRTPRGTRSPKIETPQTVYRRHPKHRQRPEAMDREALPPAPVAAAQDSPHNTHLSLKEAPMRAATIIKADIGPFPRPMPEGMFDPMPHVTATFDDGTVKELFSFYPDEIRFRAEEFIGLTEQQAHALRHKKDVAHLQS